MECIYGWTKYSNVCPLCKVTIEKLQVFDALEPEKVSEVLVIEKPENMRDEGPIERGNEEFADRCYVCK